MRALATFLLAGFFSLPAWGQVWRAMGPPGGDVRALGHDPREPSHLYLGTTDGHIFASADAGDRWRLLGRISPRFDAVVTAILVDPRDSRRLFVSAWMQDPAAGGGVFRSDDGGHNWRRIGLANQAVRALAEAPSDPDRLVAGTLQGVFTSPDAGLHWKRISPQADPELRNLDSVAVDPRNPQVLYAGTFHLPWKSTDGGRTWHSVHTGMIDDSDVMSILVDRRDPQRIFASSCSGIYRSDNGGALWEKIQGIPYSARRTTVIVQDPNHPATIFAGTTEGLWKSDDAGASWRRITPASSVINAIELPADRPGRVVLGTERRGVIASDDGGSHFHSANDGFNHRQVTAVAFDPRRPGRILVALANAPEPLLATDDGGAAWAPLGPGLAGRRLAGIYAAPNGWWVALADGGLMYNDPDRRAWVRRGTIVAASAAEPRAESERGVSGRRRLPTTASGGRTLGWLVDDMAFSQSRWFAATDHGLFVSGDRGAHWSLLPLGPLPNLPVQSVRASHDGRSLWVVSLRGLIFSHDAGRNWHWHDLPLSAGGALRLERVPGSPEGETLVASARNGLYISRDAGRSWQQAANGLPGVAVEDFAVLGHLFVAALHLGGLYVSYDEGRTWSRLRGNLAAGLFAAVTAQDDGDTVLAASASDSLYSVQLGPAASVSAASVGGAEGARGR
jgi:photosystem II stability/assembly factor-like uncharacterized protein